MWLAVCAAMAPSAARGEAAAVMVSLGGGGNGDLGAATAVAPLGGWCSDSDGGLGGSVGDCGGGEGVSRGGDFGAASMAMVSWGGGSALAFGGDVYGGVEVFCCCLLVNSAGNLVMRWVSRVWLVARWWRLYLCTARVGFGGYGGGHVAVWCDVTASALGLQRGRGVSTVSDFGELEVDCNGPGCLLFSDSVLEMQRSRRAIRGCERCGGRAVRGRRRLRCSSSDRCQLVTLRW